MNAAERELAGVAYLRQCISKENACEAQSSHQISNLGRCPRACFVELGFLLSLLDSEVMRPQDGTEGAQTLIGLAGRVCSTARAALRLAFMGFYDESLSLVRNISEIGNLVLLFNLDSECLLGWLNADKDRRTWDCSAGKIRGLIEACLSRMDLTGWDSRTVMGLDGQDTSEQTKKAIRTLMTDDEQYGALCELAVHPTPNTIPQQYCCSGEGSLGGKFQEVGFIIALQELAEVVSKAVLAFPKVLGHDEETKTRVQDAAAWLRSSVGKLKLLTKDEYFRACGAGDVRACRAGCGEGEQ